MWLHNTISSTIPEVCDAIFSEYQDELLTFPTTPDQWKEKATQFSRRNFHHTIGALDGRHVAIRCPPDSGSRYYNYKGFYSLVMLALVDADYNFLWVDVVSNGACSDSNSNSTFIALNLYLLTDSKTHKAKNQRS